jgi:uncharacterized protein YjbJ (UPF0337 family)
MAFMRHYAINLSRCDMNKDQAKGAIKEAVGKMQTKAGEAMGSETQQAKGVAKQMEGHIQKAVGDTKQAAKNLSGKR